MSLRPARLDLLEKVEHFDRLYLGDRPVPNRASEVLQHPAVLVERLFGRLVPLQVGKVLVGDRAERVLSGG
ncbi:hypothetical protein ACVI53_008495 [Bradyrhizobium barranii subsp. barranii]